MTKSRLLVAFLLLFFFIIYLFHSCTYRKEELAAANEGCYPEEIGNIFITRCATPGCHDAISNEAAGGLDLSSWDKLFEGTRAGSAVVPFRSDQSFLVNFINTYSDLGVSQLPTMPNNGTPLTRDEVILVKNWIDQGAPDCNGVIPFSGDPNRKKFYVTNQGCDLVAVFDAETKLIMRYITVGGNPNVIESPHMVRVSPDGQFWYITFTGNDSKYFQKYRTSDDAFIGQVDIGLGSWNTFAFSPDSNWAFIIDLNHSEVAYVNCDNMTLKAGTPLNPDLFFVTPHGSAVSPDGDYLYITMQDGDDLYKLDLTSFPPDGHYIHFNNSSLSRPHEVAFSPDGSVLFVTCEGTNEVKVINPITEQILTSIQVGIDPVEMSFSLSTPYLFVSCMNGNAVSVINYINKTFVKTISGFFTPHGITVDDAKGVCYVANRNSNGPPPHHTSVCGGKNGFLMAIDLNTLEIVPNFRSELSVDPYSIAIRK